MKDIETGRLIIRIANPNDSEEEVSEYISNMPEKIDVVQKEMAG